MGRKRDLFIEDDSTNPSKRFAARPQIMEANADVISDSSDSNCSVQSLELDWLNSDSDEKCEDSSIPKSLFSLRKLNKQFNIARKALGSYVVPKQRKG